MLPNCRFSLGDRPVRACSLAVCTAWSPCSTQRATQSRRPVGTICRVLSTNRHQARNRELSLRLQSSAQGYREHVAATAAGAAEGNRVKRRSGVGFGKPKAQAKTSGKVQRSVDRSQEGLNGKLGAGRHRSDTVLASAPPDSLALSAPTKMEAEEKPKVNNDAVEADMEEEPAITYSMPPTLADGFQTDVSGCSFDELIGSDAVYNHELSWLSFNWRVLSMAMKPETPVFERLRFLAITGRNLDEFFAKRVGALKRQKAAGLENLVRGKHQAHAWTPEEQLRRISVAVEEMVAKQTELLLFDVLPELRKHGVNIVNHDELSTDEQAALRLWFKQELEPLHTPLALDPGHPFPALSSLSLSLVVTLRDPYTDESMGTGVQRFAIVSMPTNFPRFLRMRDCCTTEHSLARGQNEFIPIEQVITANLPELFGGMILEEAHPFRVTRNADVERNEEEAEDLLEMMTDEVRERRFAPFVRLEVDRNMSSLLITRLANELELMQRDIFTLAVSPLGMADLDSMEVEFGMDKSLEYEPWVPLPHPRLREVSRSPTSIFRAIRSGDILLHHPYHSFATSTQAFVQAAAQDPKVVAIKSTLYRTSRDSPIIKALAKAADNGKQVAVLVELKARFDEARNVGFAHLLEDAGVNVAYGLIGLKTHCKATLVVRQESGGLRTYVHIGTGNYNPRTATVYTDYGLLTCDPELGADVTDLFKYLTGYHRQGEYRKLLVAPNNMRNQFVDLIDQEIANAKAGKPARITVKVNGLDDKVMVAKLYEASIAGVQCDCIVRGICGVRPGVPGLSENIRVISIIGQFLEHHRAFRFYNNGDPLFFIGSADWMTRNLMRRVEAATPVEDANLKKQIESLLDTCLSDEVTAWELQSDGRYILPAPGNKKYLPTSGGKIVDRSRLSGAQEALKATIRKELKNAKKKDREVDRPNIRLKKDLRRQLEAQQGPFSSSSLDDADASTL